MRWIVVGAVLIASLAPSTAHADEGVGCALHQEPIFWAVDEAGLMQRYGGGTIEQCEGQEPRRSPSGDAWAFRQEPATVRVVAADGRAGEVVKVGRDGSVHTFGTAFHGSLSGTDLAAEIVDVAFAGERDGYWLLGADGGVFAFGDAPFLGSDVGRGDGRRFAALAATPSGVGHWTATEDGRLFAHGDALELPGLANLTLRAPIVAAAATSSGQGLTLAAADGGVFTFGDAAFHGSAADLQLAAPVVDVEVTPDGTGYWLFAADGGLFAFGSSSTAMGSPTADGRGGRWTAFTRSS